MVVTMVTAKKIDPFHSQSYTIDGAFCSKVSRKAV
jgi:hypothetical protein